VDVARVLQTSQASVSKIERRDDLYLSTLRGFVERSRSAGVGAVFRKAESRSRPPEEPTTVTPSQTVALI